MRPFWDDPLDPGPLRICRGCSNGALLLLRVEAADGAATLGFCPACWQRLDAALQQRQPTASVWASAPLRLSPDETLALLTVS
jgi:hypothetical protein